MYWRIGEAYRKGDRLNKKRAVAQTNFALAHLMRQARLRAPHRPLGCDMITDLWRGLVLTKQQMKQFKDTGRLPHRGMSSWSADRSVAENFAFTEEPGQVSVVLRVPLSAVEPGTPWLWMGHGCGGHWMGNDVSIQYDRREWNPSRYNEEFEVVLPPGDVVVTAMRSFLSNEQYDVTARYIPDRGAIAASRKDGRNHYFWSRATRGRDDEEEEGNVNGYKPLYQLFDSSSAGKKRKKKVT